MKNRTVPFLKNNFIEHELIKKSSQLHNEMITFALFVNTEVNNKYENKKDGLGSSFLYKIGEGAVVLHRAILTLCMEGWTSTTPILLRSVIDCIVNCIVIVNGENDSCYMAFRYFTFEDLNLMINETSDKIICSCKHNIKETINHLDKKYKNIANGYVEDFIKQGKKKVYWYRPEYNNASGILAKYTSKHSDMKYMFQALSSATHSTMVGLNLYKDDPHTISINPRYDVKSTVIAILQSSRYLLEITRMRYVFEKIKLDVVFNELVQKMNEIGKTLLLFFKEMGTSYIFSQEIENAKKI